MRTWRDKCKPIIVRVILDNPGLEEKELRKLISKEYPFGERAMHPYKIWLSEVKKQLSNRFKHKPSEQKEINFGLFENNT